MFAGKDFGLFYRISPSDQYMPKTEEYKSIQKKQYLHYEDFTRKLEALDPSLCTEFIQIMDEQFDSMPDTFSEMFIQGFRLGAKMVIEIFYDNTEKERK